MPYRGNLSRAGCESVHDGGADGVFNPYVEQELHGTGFCRIILEAVLALSVSNSV